MPNKPTWHAVDSKTGLIFASGFSCKDHTNAWIYNNQPEEPLYVNAVAKHGTNNAGYLAQ